MGVRVEATCKMLKRRRDAAMAHVAAKRPRLTLEWDMDVDQVEDVRGVEHVQTAAVASAGDVEKDDEPRRRRSHAAAVVSRKRRLPEAVRPTKFLQVSPLQMRKVVVKVCCVGAERTTPSPRSTLHFALPGLSSQETLTVFSELEGARHELSLLNNTLPADAKIHPVFGWRAAVWSVDTPEGNHAVLYKSAKAFEGASMHAVARQMWLWRGSPHFPELGAPKLVYAISDRIRIVRQKDRLHGRIAHASLWLECICDRGESIVLFRKELHRFQDVLSGHKSPSERECHGYILHPLLVPMGSQLVAGTALHSIASFRTRGLSTERQIQQILDDMPRHVLQWEDAFVHATSRV